MCCTVLSKLVLWGCGATPFSFYESPDKKQSEWSIAQIGQGGIGLPDRDYYFDEDKEDKRKAYQVFTLLHFLPCLAALGHMYTAHVPGVAVHSVRYASSLSTSRRHHVPSTHVMQNEMHRTRQG